MNDQSTLPVFQPGKNCWRVEKADHASIIVDYANYYRDLHRSICKAQKSVFILGWDIDGRIELVRGKDKDESGCPASLFDLLKWKSEKDLHVKIFLNKWDYSIFFAKEREPFANFHWAAIKSDNFHYCTDGALPIGACHHQKIAVIDDEVAYCGGMDIAPARWDFREHHPVNHDRADPQGLLAMGEHEHFAPYHDLMMVTSGPAARALAQLFRERWSLACNTPVPELGPAPTSHEIPHAWPDFDPPDFYNVDIAIARTQPPLRSRKRREEIIAAYLDEIPKAEKFIYIENQFLVQLEIARALNKQLREKPDLRVLAISCDHPKGVMERKSMWTPRLKFREIIEQGGVADRVALVHPISREDGHEDPVRIHSKLMIIDDKFLHLGSANINNRSMGFDTECDQVIIGMDDAACAKIAAVRTDLIREHSGREADEIERLVAENAPITAFLEEVPNSRQHFKRINDEAYRHEKFVGIVKKIADPRRPLITADLTVPFSKKRFKRHLSKPWIFIAAAIAVIALIIGALLWADNPVSLKDCIAWFKTFADKPYAIPFILGVFVLGSLVLFPLTLLIAATAAAFGPVEGFALSLAGTLLAALTGYGIGRQIGFSQIRNIFGKKADKVRNKVNKGGVMGVTIIRMLPISPFGVMNLLLGVNGIAFTSYVIGTLLGVLPGTIALAFLGSSISEIISNPDPKNMTMLAVGFGLWMLVIYASHLLEKKYNRGL